VRITMGNEQDQDSGGERGGQQRKSKRGGEKENGGSERHVRCESDRGVSQSALREQR